MRTANIVVWTIAAILFVVWGIQRVEYALRPDGMKKSVYSVDALINV